jgi:hypothetical protein
MIDMNLLLTLFFNESKVDGWRTFSELITRSRDCVLTVFAAGAKRRSSADAFHPADRFNIAESLMIYDTRELRIRYRPSVASPRWSPLSPISKTHPSDEESHELFQLFLTLGKFSRPGLSEQARTCGVLELLCTAVADMEALKA